MKKPTASRMAKGVVILFVIAGSVLFFSVLINNYLYKSRAGGDSVVFKIRLQGAFDSSNPNLGYKTKVAFYTATGLEKESAGQMLTRESGSNFKVEVAISSLSTAKTYAVFIKPEKYLGRLFCDDRGSTGGCNTAGLVIGAGKTFDFTSTVFMAGDLDNQDGRVAGDDLSKIFKDLGKTSVDNLSADINIDSIVNTVDYSLALYSLSKNSVDDPVNFKPTPSPVSTSFPSPAATLTVSPATNTPTPAAAQAQAGSCNTTVTGRIYIGYTYGVFSGTECEQVSGQTGRYCVSSQTDCNPANCIENTITTIKNDLPRYASTCNISINLDEAKTRPTLNCQTTFLPGSCLPAPTEAVNCNRNSGASCN